MSKRAKIIEMRRKDLVKRAVGLDSTLKPNSALHTIILIPPIVDAETSIRTILRFSRSANLEWVNHGDINGLVTRLFDLIDGS